ncbi:hypothetical protein U1Q18_015828 [Sarracenia purpurea var. burkii]
MGGHAEKTPESVTDSPLRGNSLARVIGDGEQSHGGHRCCMINQLEVRKQRCWVLGVGCTTEECLGAEVSEVAQCSLELEKTEFLVGSVIDAVVSQVMILLREKGLQLIRDIPEEIKTLAVYGDQVRVQQVLADFLFNMVRYAPSPQGWVEIQVRPRLKQVSDEITLMHIEFRIVCPGEGLPPDLVQDMFHSSQWVTREGLGLSMCRKILKLMNGEVQYIRESERCYFLIILELPMPRRSSKSFDRVIGIKTRQS